MATLTLGGRSYDIRPFRLRELRRAGPYIDRLARRTGPLDGVAAVADAAADMLGVLAAGLDDAAVEALNADLRLEDLEALHTAFEAVMAEAGLKRPVEGDTPEAAASGEPAGARAAP